MLIMFSFFLKSIKFKCTELKNSENVEDLSQRERRSTPYWLFLEETNIRNISVHAAKHYTLFYCTILLCCSTYLWLLFVLMVERVGWFK